jgi:phosphoribosyl-ATP pyrophosphohydrolase/phosphoribosyl-AMP cyclohydrolase
MNREALAATLESGRVTFWSRSRAALWVKGETSGHTLALRAIAADCDGDALLVAAVPAGPTCHSGTPSCFGPEASPPLLALERTIAARLAGGSTAESESYTAQLAAAGVVRVAQKVGEEAVEAALAAATGDDEGLVAESADLVYHLALLLALRNRSLADVAAELERRAAQGGGRDRRTA